MLAILAVPVGIYLFLRTFGTNRFDIPVYHRSGIDNCGQQTGVHTIDPWLPGGPGSGQSNGIRIVSFMTASMSDPMLASYILNLTRVYDALVEYRPLELITVIDPALDSSWVAGHWHENLERLIPETERWHFLHVANQNDYRELIRCGFGFHVVGMDPHYSIVLIDTDGRIRGYYGGNDEDADRVILESRILFDNLENL